jgi:signal transduction histidine kinase
VRRRETDGRDMRRPIETRLFVLSVSCLLALFEAAPLWAEQHRVLTLLAMRRGAPGAVVLDQVIQAQLSEHLQGALDYYSEYLDVGRFSDPGYAPALRGFLESKYAGYQFDLVVASTNAAVDFLRGHRDELFPGVPVVFSTAPGVDLGPNATGVTHTIQMAASIEMALQLQPHVRQVYVLRGAAPSDKYYEDLTREQVRHLESRLSIIYWSEFTLSEAIRRVANLPRDAILYAMPFTEDVSGQRFSPTATLQAVTAAANVPVYHFSDLAIGYGVVGGAMNTTEVLARGLADLAVRVLRGERADDIPVAPLDVLRYQVDWRQLQRWGLNEARLPPGTAVMFREPGVWERYQRYIVGTLALVVLQTALIAGLLVQRRRRQRVEDALRVSSERNQDLAGRLITAQEAERARIARDLHDDASQQLAGLAMSLSVLKARVSRSIDESDLAESLSNLQQQTVALGEDLRTLSHELHPGVLQHAGIVAALKSYSMEFERRAGMRTRFEASESFSDLDPETSLCLYRVAQEALTNAGRHSNASDVVVKLTRANRHFNLSVRDNGAGFEASQRTGRGLGLQSIDERVRLRNGRTVIVSRPGQGTMVTVSMPCVEPEQSTAVAAS